MSKLYSELYKQAQVSLARILEGEEHEIIRIYGTALAEIRSKLDALYKKYAVDGKLSNGELGKYNRLLGEQDQIQEILEHKMKKVDDLTKRLTKEQYQESFYRHAYAIDQSGGMSLQWGQIPEEAVEAAVNSNYSKLASSKAMKLSRNGTVEKVKQEISLATIRGDSYAVLANRISDALGVRIVGKNVQYIDKGAAARSLMVARTEGQRVLVDGQMAASKQAVELGCDIETIWDATLDGRTRPAHGALDGKSKDDPEKGWNVPEIGWVSAPLHSGIASFDINCRCRIRDQVKGYPPTERYVRGDGIQPYQTYDKWCLEQASKNPSLNAEKEKMVREYQQYKIRNYPDKVTIDRANKFENYILSETSTSGKDKARVFKASLGITSKDSEYLEQQIRHGLSKSSIEFIKADQYGRKYKSIMKITGLNGNTATIHVGWTFDNTNATVREKAIEFPRLVTAFVEKK